jgi:hypothetical protein
MTPRAEHQPRVDPSFQHLLFAPCVGQSFGAKAARYIGVT